MDEQLRKLQMVDLDILRRILRICEEHRLTYFILGGTLLGAVRHKGFIPWDDDVDIGLPRPDYEKFLQFADRELEAPYRIHTTQNNTGLHLYYYARVENTAVKLEKAATVNKLQINAFVDVFPLDGVPNDERKKQRWMKKCRRRKTLFDLSGYSYKAADSSLKKNRSLPRRILRTLFFKLKLDRMINAQRAWKRLDRALKAYPYEECDRLINFCGYWGERELFAKSVYGEGALYPFEDLMLNGPKNYDFVLTQMYGDYMTPPPESERNHHHLSIVEI